MLSVLGAKETLTCVVKGQHVVCPLRRTSQSGRPETRPQKPSMDKCEDECL